MLGYLPEPRVLFYAMKILRLVAVGLVFVLAVGVCRANLGETEAQCVARYGAESDIQDGLGYDQVGDKAATFQAKTPQGLLTLRITFLHGRDCREQISNADASRGLSEDQMKAILDAESAGLKWRKGRSVYHTDRIDASGVTSASENWLRSDGATASFGLSGRADSRSLSGSMEMATKEYSDAQGFFDKQDGAH
jgi:hypothetical protein